MASDVRICFFGDSFVNGTLDESYLGWPGRVCADLRARGLDLTCYNLGIRRDTSGDILARWRGEAERRLPATCDGRLVFSFGVNDCVAVDGRPRVSSGDSLANAQRILEEATSWKPTLVVGPPPIRLHDQGDLGERIRAVSVGIEKICLARAIPFCDLFTRLIDQPAWFDEMGQGDGVHPMSAGYRRLAGIVQAWEPWLAWFKRV